jgi:hypothetical protein
MTTSMKATVRSFVPWPAAAAIGGAIALAPIAYATIDPVATYDADSTNPSSPSYHVDNQDEVNTTNGFLDMPF